MRKCRACVCVNASGEIMWIIASKRSQSEFKRFAQDMLESETEPCKLIFRKSRTQSIADNAKWD